MMMVGIKTFYVAVVLAGSAILSSAATNVVTYGGSGQFAFAFNPPDITIKAGDTVIWTNVSGIHNVVGDTPGTPLCGCAGTGIAAFTNVFNSPGDYLYHCSFHSSIGMTGIVRVASVGAPRLTGVGIFTNGFIFVVTNTAYHTNIIQASADLSDTNNWIPLNTNFPSTNSFNFTDTNIAIFTKRFYRVIQK
jgi:plastocyanin